MRRIFPILLIANTCFGGGVIGHGIFRHGTIGKNPPIPFTGPYPSQLVFALDATASGAISGNSVSDVYTTSRVVASPQINNVQGVAYITNYAGQSSMYVNASDGAGSDTQWAHYNVNFSGTALNNVINFSASKGVMAWKVCILPAMTAGFGTIFFDGAGGTGNSCGPFVRDDGVGNWVIQDAQLVTSSGGVNYNGFSPLVSVPEDASYHWIICQWDTDNGSWEFYEDNSYGLWYYNGANPLLLGPAASFVIGRSAECFTQKFFYWQGVTLTASDVANLVNNF